MMESSGSSRSFDVDEDCSYSGNGQQQKFKGTVNLLRTDRGIWISARLNSETLCTCSLCLSRYIQSLQIIIEEECLPTYGSKSSLDKASSGEDTEEKIVIDDYHILDLTEVARQYTVLNVPMKPVCVNDCRGICSKCGRNLNEGICQCDKVIKNLSWESLSRLELIPHKEKSSRNL